MMLCRFVVISSIWILLFTVCFVIPGCRFSWLLPILEQEYVADEIVSAVLTNQAMLCLPRIINVINVLKRWVKTGLNFMENHCQT